MSTFILAEKPDQARSYMRGLGIKVKSPTTDYGRGSTFLDPVTTVIGSFGHLWDLAEPEAYGDQYKERLDLSVLPIFPKKFKYQLNPEHKTTNDMIRNQAWQADRIIVSTDKDNEGGAIAFILLRFAGVLGKKKIQRIYPAGLDKAGVVYAFKHLETIDQTWADADAAIARSRSDWLIGMNLSRLYTAKLHEIGIDGNFAVGRALSSTLSIICEWYRAIENFKPEPIYRLNAKTQLNDGMVVGLKSKFETVGDGKNDPKQEMMNFLNQHHLRQKSYGIVDNVEQSIKQRYAPALLDKSGLYSEMKRVAKWSQKKSKKVMQANYQQGYQTYPRTDSNLIDLHMYEYAKNNFNNYLNALGLSGQFEFQEMPEEQRKKYLTKDSSAAAHFAIFPTEKIMTPDAKVTPDQRLMWEVVVRSALALFIRPYTYISNKIIVKVNDVLFEATNSSPREQGWRAIIMKPVKKSKRKRKIKAVNQVIDYQNYAQKGMQVPVILQVDQSHTTCPKPLRTIQIYGKNGLMEKAADYIADKKLAKILKKAKGIGTSATKDTIMESLENKGYVAVDTNDVITVTGNGWLMNALLSGSEVSSPALSAKWEEAYKLISKHKQPSQKLIQTTALMIVDEFKRVGGNWKAENIKKYYLERKRISDAALSIGTCPVCKKGHMIFDPYRGPNVDKKGNKIKKGQYDGWKCDQCGYRLWRHWGTVSFTKTDVKKLLKGQTTSIKKNIKSSKKKDKTYQAAFKLELDSKSQKFVIKPIFNDLKHPKNKK